MQICADWPGRLLDRSPFAVIAGTMMLSDRIVVSTDPEDAPRFHALPPTRLLDVSRH